MPQISKIVNEVWEIQEVLWFNYLGLSISIKINGIELLAYWKITHNLNIMSSRIYEQPHRVKRILLNVFIRLLLTYH